MPAVSVPLCATSKRLFLSCMSLAREIVRRRYALQLHIKKPRMRGFFMSAI